jgi:hypothetical protein
MMATICTFSAKLRKKTDVPSFLVLKSCTYIHNYVLIILDLLLHKWNAKLCMACALFKHVALKRSRQVRFC